MQEIIPSDNERIQELIVAIRNTPTLEKMISIAWQLACLFVVSLIVEELTKRADRICRWPLCPECGARIENKERGDRQIKSFIGLISWNRKIGRCPNGCEIGQIVPLDEELGLTPNQRVCVDIKRAACLLAVFVPYGIASMLLFLITNVKVSSLTIWNWVQEAGADAMQKLQNELTAMQDGESIDPETIEDCVAQLPLLIGGDGVNVPLRPHGGSPEGKTDWREVKVGIFARLNRYINTKGRSVTRLLRRRLVAVLGDKDEFQLRMELESKKQNIDNAATVVWLSDGGPGFWGIFHRLFSGHAVGILDFYHAAQNLWKAAAAWLDGRTRAARDWFVGARHRLRHGQTRSVLAELGHVMRTDETMNDESWVKVYNCYEYLLEHREHMRYSHFKDRLGLPIGSGMVESACKWLIQQRFKCVGMRWSRKGLDHLLHLRLAWVNGRFDELFGLE